MKQLAVFVALFLQTLTLAAQVNPQSVVIVRDSFGVPHIHGRTDADAAYGLAWAHSEDDFKSIQENLLAAKGMLGEVAGKEGVLFDFGLQFFGIDTVVEQRYAHDISPDFKRVLSGYIQGINDYAAAHPEEVLLPKALPFTEQDVIKGSTLTLTLFAGAGMALKSIRDNHIELLHQPNEVGSNSLALAPNKTEDGKAWLLINSHQPIEGRFAWYEAHIRSDDGWDVIGGLFPGGTTIFLGTNQHLGWAHTTNYHTFGDVYCLRHRGNRYWYDGAWQRFGIRKAKLRLKLGPFKLKLSRRIRTCAYGPVFPSKHGWYALRFPGASDIRATEQWYRMNRATDLPSFQKAVQMEAIPLFNILYADVDGNIFYESGGQIPLRDSTLNWKIPIDGQTSAYRWTQLVPYAAKPRLVNPGCGYLYSCNQTPYAVSGDSCRWQGGFPGVQLFNYNRGERFGELLAAIPGKLSWQDFLDIKFDKHYCRNGGYMRNFKALYAMDGSRYPDIKDAVERLQRWNLGGEADNREAPLALVLHQRLMDAWKVPFAVLSIKREPLTEEEIVRELRASKRFMLRTYGTLDIALGDMQRLIRGSGSLPASGLREVARAADSKLVDKANGIWKVGSGDGYVQMNRYSSTGVEVLSVNAYGASSHPESKHYTDQMQLFVGERFKRMTFDWEEIERKAERVYRPGE